jgi:hypothetical protein
MDRHSPVAWQTSRSRSSRCGCVPAPNVASGVISFRMDAIAVSAFSDELVMILGVARTSTNGHSCPLSSKTDCRLARALTMQQPATERDRCRCCQVAAETPQTDRA